MRFILHFAIRASPFYGVLRDYTADYRCGGAQLLRLHAIAQSTRLPVAFLLHFAQDFLCLLLCFSPQYIRFLACQIRLLCEEARAILPRLPYQLLCLRVSLLHSEVGLPYHLLPAYSRSVALFASRLGAAEI